MKFLDNLKYSKDHEWVKIDGNIAYVGITDFAQGELGDIVYVDIDKEGEEVDQNEIFGTVEAVKTVSDLFMPIAGKILEVNEQLTNEPELVNSDPYDKGWMIKMEISDQAQLESLMGVEEYKSLVGA